MTGSDIFYFITSSVFFLQTCIHFLFYDSTSFFGVPQDPLTALGWSSQNFIIIYLFSPVDFCEETDIHNGHKRAFVLRRKEQKIEVGCLLS